MLKIKNLTEDQMFAAALAYETSGCDIPMEEFLQKVLARYEEIHDKIGRASCRERV